MGEKYNGKEDSQEGGEQREVGCLRNIIETHAIMENRGRIDAKREREITVGLVSATRSAIGPFKEDSIRSGQVVVNQLARTRVSDETFTVYGIYSRNRDLIEIHPQSLRKSRRGRDLTVCPLNEE